MKTKEQMARQYAINQCGQASEECYAMECTCRPLIGDIARIRKAAFEAGWQAAMEHMMKRNHKYDRFTYEGRTYRRIDTQDDTYTCEGCCFKNKAICTHPYYDEKGVCAGKIYIEDKEDKKDKEEETDYNRKRKIYFGTNGRPGHNLMPICGNFSREKRDILDKVDAVELHGRGGWFDYDCLGHTFRVMFFPYSLDDKRPGSKTIFMIENGTVEDFKWMFRYTLFAAKKFMQIKDRFGYTEEEIIQLFGDILFYKED